MYSKETYIHKEKKQRQLRKEWKEGLTREASFNSKSSNNPKSRLVINARKRSAKDGRECTISSSDLFISYKCPYLGIELTDKKGRHQSNVSLDRIDSSKGYIKGNVQVISYLANRMKQEATVEQLIAFAKGVLKLHGRNTDTTLPS